LKTYVPAEFLAAIRHKVTEGMTNLNSTKKIVDVEFDMITAKGRTISIDAKGIFKGAKALGLLQEVTEKKKAGDAISETKQNTSSFMTTCPTCILC